MSATEIAVAESAARAAGALLRNGYGRAWSAERKGAIDLVTEKDRESEREVLARIRASFPSDAILAEESGGAGLDAERLWIVDPLDGTTNYAHAHPQFCVTIAFARRGEVVAAVTYDPLREELFAAEKGRGATLNGRPIRVSDAPTLDDALIATGFPYDRRERADFYMRFYREAVVRTQGVRRAGSAALDIAWVACGRMDAYFEFGIKPWDIGAGELLVREAGGVVTDMKGGPHRLDGKNTLSSNGRIHEAMLAMLRDAWPTSESGS